MSLHLKIKFKYLSEESRIIKREELKLRRKIQSRIEGREARQLLRQSLHEHRKNVVRPAARSTHLAYGFLRGRSYRQMEDERTRTVPDWAAVEKMALRYGQSDSRDIKQRFEEWKSAATDDQNRHASL